MLSMPSSSTNCCLPPKRYIPRQAVLPCNSQPPQAHKCRHQTMPQKFLTLSSFSFSLFVSRLLVAELPFLKALLLVLLLQNIVLDVLCTLCYIVFHFFRLGSYFFGLCLHFVHLRLHTGLQRIQLVLILRNLRL